MSTRKTALVTGSTSGIGLGIAASLAATGANVILNGFGDAETIEKLRSTLAADHAVEVRHDGADRSQQDAIEKMMGSAIAEFGAVDILVNNAGIQFVAPIDEFPVAKRKAIRPGIRRPRRRRLSSSNDAADRGWTAQ